jgi:hypothetical protein
LLEHRTKKIIILDHRDYILQGMKTDGNDRKTPSPISITIFFYQKWERYS